MPFEKGIKVDVLREKIVSAIDLFLSLYLDGFEVYQGKKQEILTIRWKGRCSEWDYKNIPPEEELIKMIMSSGLAVRAERPFFSHDH